MNNSAGVPDSSDNSSSVNAHDWESQALTFEGQYVGQMEMAADVDTVAGYLDRHQDWFQRCAHPMQADPIAVNGYALLIGRFGALGHEVEPKIGLHLLPQAEGIYRIETIPVPDYIAHGYDVDFNAALALTEVPEVLAEATAPQMPPAITQVDWTLNLAVTIQLPRFVQALPSSLVKASGDKLLNQIVRQVSKRLTQKVQEDFHQSCGLALPANYQRHRFWSNWGKD